ncbi:MAG: hypothetical protein AAFV53_23615 [Myxococcota bacterium]
MRQALFTMALLATGCWPADPTPQPEDTAPETITDLIEQARQDCLSALGVQPISAAVDISVDWSTVEADLSRAVGISILQVVDRDGEQARQEICDGSFSIGDASPIFTQQLPDESVTSLTLTVLGSLVSGQAYLVGLYNVPDTDTGAPPRTTISDAGALIQVDDAFVGADQVRLRDLDFL